MSSDLQEDLIELGECDDEWLNNVMKECAEKLDPSFDKVSFINFCCE